MDGYRYKGAKGDPMRKMSHSGWLTLLTHSCWAPESLCCPQLPPSAAPGASHHSHHVITSANRQLCFCPNQLPTLKVWGGGRMFFLLFCKLYPWNPLSTHNSQKTPSFTEKARDNPPQKIIGL